MSASLDKNTGGDGRLSPVLMPYHYDLRYDEINLTKFTFRGTVTLNGKAVATSLDDDGSNQIVISLHASELQLTKATLTWETSVTSKPKLEAVEFRYKLNDHIVQIVFDPPADASADATPFIQADQDYALTIDFMGILNDQMRGLYRSTYRGLDGTTTQVMATTQFESTDARRAFPCLDEPALKATFCLTVVIPAHLQCISNTPVASVFTKVSSSSSSSSSHAETVMREITFQKTPKMSTYLLALVVGQFDCISQTLSQHNNNITLTIYTVPGKAHQARFSLDTAVRCLALYQDLFQIPYPLVKLDTLAIPDFAAGAMENWGCMTYREAKILEQPGVTSESTRRGMARTICHETAHQWFGNLVTMKWWTQLWLKEGVARFMEFVATDKLFPEWDMWTAFVKDVQSLALSLDSMQTSHPVEVEVHHVDEIESIFDSISYAKGASIIRMIAEYIGTEQFTAGMRLYLSRHAHGNAVTNDVWGALEEVSGVPVIEFMAPWTLKVGFPILTIGADGSIEMTRFLAAGRDTSKEATVWPIPVTAIVEGSDKVEGPWVINGPKGDDSASLSAKIAEWTSSGKWFKLNVKQTGFYRVAYAQDHWKRLANVMDPRGPLSIADRLGLVSDSFAAGSAGYSSIVDSLSLIADFGSHEAADFVIWEELAENLSAIASLFRSEPFYPRLQEYLKRIFSRQLSLLGWTASSADEPALTRALRATVISMLGVAGDKYVWKQAYDIFMSYTQDSEANKLDGDLRRTIFRCALRHDEGTVFDLLKRLYEERSTFPEEQRDCLSVMGCVSDEARHLEMLDYTLFSGKVRSQDIGFPLATLAGATDSGGLATYNYMKANFSKLHASMGRSPMWKSYVALSCRGLKTSEQADEAEAFFDDPAHPIGLAKTRLAQALEVVRTKAGRRERDRASLEQFLSSD